MPLTRDEIRTALLSAPPIKREPVTITPKPGAAPITVFVREPTAGEQGRILNNCIKIGADKKQQTDIARMRTECLLTLCETEGGERLWEATDANSLSALPSTSPIWSILAAKAVEMMGMGEAGKKEKEGAEGNAA